MFFTKKPARPTRVQGARRPARSTCKTPLDSGVLFSACGHFGDEDRRRILQDRQERVAGEVLQADRVGGDLGVAERPGHLLEVAQHRPHVVGKLDRPRHRIGALDDFPPVRGRIGREDDGVRAGPILVVAVLVDEECLVDRIPLQVADAGRDFRRDRLFRHPLAAADDRLQAPGPWRCSRGC